MTTEDSRTLELRDYLRVLRRHKWIIIVTVIVCVGIALAMSLTRAPVYVSGSSVLMEQRLVDRIFVPFEPQLTGDAAENRRGNELQIMSGPKVRAEVAKSLGRQPDEVSFQPIEGTDVIRVVARGGDPKSVAETANAYAETYIDVRTKLTTDELNEVALELQTQIQKLDEQIAGIDAAIAAAPVGPQDPLRNQRAQLVSQKTQYTNQNDQIQLGLTVAGQGSSEILAEAFPARKPINKEPVKNALAGLAIGLVLGIALAFLREYVDDSIKTKEDLEEASRLNVVGMVPALPDWKKREAAMLVSSIQPRSPAAEAYRSVRTSVEFLSLDQPIGSLQVTSALASEGKTSTIANLAVTFARAGQRVIVLCCDLRRPRVHEFFGLSNRVGFTSVLLGDAPIASAIQAADRELPIGLVASGPLPPNPAELLTSKRAVDAIEELDRRCDLLLIDSPPILPVTDGLVISGLVDGVLLVATSGQSTKRGMKRATELLRQVEAPLIGAVLNGVHSRFGYGYSYGDDRYYQSEAPPDRKNGAESRNGKGRTRVAARDGR